MKFLSVKLKKGKGAFKSDPIYKNEVNGEDFKQIAMILLDLELEGVPISKAVKEFLSEKGKGFPW